VPEFLLKSSPLRKVVIIVPLAAAVIAGHLLPGLDATGLDIEIRNALHVIAFAIIAAVIFEVLPMRPATAVLSTLAFVAVLGALAELAQTQVGKSFGVTDLFRDLAGATLYLCARLVWQWTNSTKRAPAIHFSARLISVALGALLFVPLTYWLYTTNQVAAKYPTILDFEDRWDAYLFQTVESEFSFVTADASGRDFDETFAEITLLDHDWSGIKISPLVPDWSSFQYLTMQVAIVGAYESRIVVFLNDGAHPGYSSQHGIGIHNVGPEPTVIRFPLHDVVDKPGRPPLDPSKIKLVYIIARTKSHSTSEKGGPRLLLDNIRLE
jgi:hypothetical protein